MQKLLEACHPLWKSATEKIEAADEQAADTRYNYAVMAPSGLTHSIQMERLF
jgi:hypothetical protein